MKKNVKKLHIILAVVMVISLLSACQTAEPPSRKPVEVDDIENIRVRTVEATESVVDVEKFNLPNCGGTGELTQSLGTQASVLKGVTIGAKATTMAGGEVAIPQTAKLKLEIEVELAYQQTYQSANSRLDTIKMTAAKETDVTYVVFWEEQRFDSIVSYTQDGEVYEAPYSYVLRVPKIDDSYQENCSNSTANTQPEYTSDEVESVNTTTSQPIVPTSSEIQVVPPSSSVRLEEVQKTGAETRIVYDMYLADDEVIAGDAYDFQDGGLPCNAFLITGPGSIQFAVLDGGWYRYSGVNSPEKAEEMLQKQVKYLQGHWFCKDIEIRVIRVNAGQ